MPPRIALAVILAALLIASWRAPCAADDPDASAQWERVEPAEPAPAPALAPPSRAVQPQPIPPELCAGIGAVVGQLAMLRDKGIQPAQLKQHVDTEGANGQVQQYVLGYINYVYDHPELSPAQIRAQVTAGCARPHR